ncbi:MAG: TolC family protein, partial [Verrucomicrobiaceae bacterium]|nr:TolC family protein [Verrucomicrobiaceae bacterium]
DVEGRFSVGKASELEVLNAKVAVSGREAQLAVAKQSLTETVNMAVSFLGNELVGMRAAAPSPSLATETDAAVCFDKAQRFNPEYLGRQRQIAIETLRLSVAQNQGKPSLDFLGSFGVTGLSENFADAMSDVGRVQSPTWSVGLELRVPLGGGKKGKSDIHTASLRRKQAIRQLSVLRTQMRGAVENALFKVRSAQSNAVSFAKTTGLNEKLLDTELERLKAGKSSAGKILEAEQALFEARNSELENLVGVQRSLLEMDVVMGTVLEKLGIEWTRAQLAARTASLFKQQHIPDDSIVAYRQSLDSLIQQNP